MIISKVEIEHFRGLKNITMNLGKVITIIAGQNGAMKSTILGIISQPFSIRNLGEFSKEKTIDGYAFESKFSDKFKWSKTFDIPGDHKWRIYIDNKDIYSKDYFEATSASRKDKGKEETIRIISSEGKKKGADYIKCPVIFLSLKRVVPLGEEKKEDLSNILSNDEREFVAKYHKEILSILDDIEDVSSFKSSNKTSLLANTSYYDYSVNSAGQDNIGKIISSILSFKRLKEKYPEEYKGGLLFIDEIDATLFPCAQEKLMDFLRHWGSKLNLQIIVTTHSYNILKLAKTNEYIYNTKILYMRKHGEEITCTEDPSIEQIEADLNIKVVEEEKTEKIRVYCEDAEAACFISNLLMSKQAKLVSLMKKVTLGCENLKELTKRKVPEFCNSIVVLDGDSSSKYANYCVLPGKGKSPEQLLYDYLKDLSENDEFWDDEIGGYTKQVCFRNFGSRPSNREKFKEWFKEQLPHWGANAKKLFDRWKKDNKEETEKFQKDFQNAYDHCLNLSKN